MVETFEDQVFGDSHAAFQEWRDRHPYGFFLNYKSRKTVMLHRVGCLHSGNSEWQAGEWGSLTKRKKVCSPRSQELRDLVVRDGATLEICNDCQPD